MDAKIYSEMATLEQQHWWFVARRKILDRILSTLPLPDNAQILEAGCGTGGNLSMLSRYGEVYAMEANDEALAFSSAKNIASVAAGRLPTPIPFNDQKFDLITLLDVLEHLDEDAASLSALSQRLNSGGWLLLTVPAYPFLWSRHDDLHHHKRRYIASDLRKLLNTNGYRVEYLSYFNTWLFPLIAAARLANLGNNDAGDATMPNKLINTLLTNIFASERYLLGKVSLPAGVSLLALARKSNDTQFTVEH
jgi:SAM-dependent methyltransferase